MCYTELNVDRHKVKAKPTFLHDRLEWVKLLSTSLKSDQPTATWVWPSNIWPMIKFGHEFLSLEFLSLISSSLTGKGKFDWLKPKQFDAWCFLKWPFFQSYNSLANKHLGNPDLRYYECQKNTKETWPTWTARYKNEEVLIKSCTALKLCFCNAWTLRFFVLP